MLQTLRSMRRTLIPGHEANEPLASALRMMGRDYGVGPEWQQTVYGEYYARSADVYAAVKLRADSVARPPLVVYQRDQRGARRPVGPAHPVQRLLDHVNEWWSPGDLVRATETYLSLWGSEFWYLGRSEGGEVSEIWPLRPDRVRIIREGKRYVAGFTYSEGGREFPMLREEVVWFRYFNPLDEYAGFSPMAAARLNADMGIDAVRFNREFFRNSASPQDLVFRARGPVTDEQVAEFYQRLEQRFTGPAKANRPIVTGEGWEVERLGLNQRDMEWLSGLRWSLEAVARVFGVPLPLLEDFSRATYNNVREARRMFWEKTVVPELVFLQGEINEGLLPKLGRAAEGLKVAFDLSTIEAVSESETERTRRHVELVKAGILSVDEVRRERGLSDLEEGDGDGAAAQP